MHRSEVRKPSTKASELVWRVPLALLRQRPFARLKLTHKILFVVLWNWAGCRAGSVSGSCSAIAAELGLADRRIREWLPKLAEVGLVVIVDWTREGALTVEVNDPAEIARGHVRRPDPQGSLFDNDEPDEPETAPAFSVPFPPAETVPIPPTPSGEPTPRAPARPRAHGIIEREHSSIEKDLSPPSVISAGEAGPAPWDLPPFAPKSSGVSSANPGPLAVGEIISRSVFDAVRLLDPADQKSRLVSLIDRVVCDPAMDASIPRRAAELVVTEQVDRGQLVAILVGISDMHKSGVQFRRGPGAVFLWNVRKWSQWEELTRRDR